MEFTAFENSMITIKPNLNFNRKMNEKTASKLQEFFKGLKNANITDPKAQENMLISIIENCTKSYQKRIKFQLIPPTISYESG